MARTIKEIEDKLKEAFVSNEIIRDAYGLDKMKTFEEQFSKTSIESTLIFIFSSSAWALEQLWDVFRKETEQSISDSYVTSQAWYYQKALDFQLGDELEFDRSTYSFRYPELDISKQVVRNVAVRQVLDNDVTKLKIYFSDTNKQPLTGSARSSFETYMREIGAAGTHFLFVSEQPDQIRVHMHIYYNALVLDNTGTRLDGGGKPVEEAIENYLSTLEYGGIFYASKLIDAVQSTDGVLDVVLDGTTWKDAKDNRRRIDAVSGAFVYIKNGGDIIYSIDS